MDVLAEQGQGLRYCLMREASRWVHIGLDAPSWRVCSCTGPRAPSRLHCVWGPESLLGSSGLVVKMGSSGGSKNGVLPALMFNTCQRRSPKRTNDVNQDSRGKKGLRQWARAGHRTWGGGGHMSLQDQGGTSVSQCVLSYPCWKPLHTQGESGHMFIRTENILVSDCVWLSKHPERGVHQFPRAAVTKTPI